jgi:NADH-quinone oxidoreductase E subunit
MAWITKNSAGMKVERRAEPYLTEAMKKDLRERMLPRYATSQAALLPTLHTVQHAHGWLPPQALMEVAEFLNLKPADVLDTASFYEEYWLKPKGEQLVQVCRSIACEFCGQREITNACKAKLGMDVGETTDDGKFTLIELECLGSCGTAPAMLINEKLFENLTPEQVPQLLDDVASGKIDTHPGVHGQAPASGGHSHGHH